MHLDKIATTIPTSMANRQPLLLDRPVMSVLFFRSTLDQNYFKSFLQSTGKRARCDSRRAEFGTKSLVVRLCAKKFRYLTDGNGQFLRRNPLLMRNDSYETCSNVLEDRPARESACLCLSNSCKPKCIILLQVSKVCFKTTRCRQTGKLNREKTSREFLSLWTTGNMKMGLRKAQCRPVKIVQYAEHTPAKCSSNANFVGIY